MLKLNIQSFGDVITNSSSEVYCIPDPNGVKSIEGAIRSVCKALNPDINLDDHIDINISIAEDTESDECDENGNYLSMPELYQKEFDTFCENNTNEQILNDFPDFYEDFCYNHMTNRGGYPCLEMTIVAKTKLGEVLRDSIYNILYAFEWTEIYN